MLVWSYTGAIYPKALFRVTQHKSDESYELVFRHRRIVKLGLPAIRKRISHVIVVGQFISRPDGAGGSRETNILNDSRGCFLVLRHRFYAKT